MGFKPEILRQEIDKPLDIPRHDYSIKLKILGLRDLAPSGILNVQKPFITFNINSMLDQSNQFKLEEQYLLRTVPDDSGNNPNIMNIIEFDIKLPCDYNYFPHLSVIITI